MARISEQTIEQIRSAADIIEVVSGYVELKKKGRNFFGRCPFHDEKTPSFSVNQERQIYKCFGCGVGGGSINFIMAIENLEFIDSIRHLAEQYGIELEIDNIPGQTPDLLTQLMDIHDKTAIFYYNNFSTDEGQKAYKYLVDRGLSKETIKYFRLGYSMNSFDSLKTKLQGYNFSSKSLSESGLISNNDRGYYDKFRSRIMFGITNTNGKIIAFAGRVFNNDDSAKYVNSPETPIYKKNKILYGLWASKNEIRSKEYAIVVEGYLDFLQLFQSGIKNVVAVSGTSFTDNHAKLIKRFCKKIYLAYDGDSAGMNAAIRAGYILLKFELEAKIISIPDGKDPDDWVKMDGPEPFNAAINDSYGLLEFHTKNTNHDISSATGMSQFIQNVLSELVKIENPVLRELHCRSLAELTKVSEQSIINSINLLISQKDKKLQYKNKNTNSELKLTEVKSPLRRIEDELIQLCFVNDLKTRIIIYEQLDSKWLNSNSVKLIFDAVFIHLNTKRTPSVSMIMSQLKDENSRKKLSSLVFNLEKINSSPLMAKQCINRLEEFSLKNKLKKFREKLKNINLISENESEEIVNQIAKIQTRLIKLKSDKNEII